MLVLATEKGPWDYRFEIVAKTMDDSIGDAFDKTAKLLQIPWLDGKGPGPSLEAYALPDLSSNLYQTIPPFRLPIPKDLAFSYAGLKTNVHRQLAKIFPNTKKAIPRDLARAMARRFQEAAVQHVTDKVDMVLDQLEERSRLGRTSPVVIHSVIASGGVASNTYLRTK
jgi:N6-L-threonylcarbamoyladenine synthase